MNNTLNIKDDHTDVKLLVRNTSASPGLRSAYSSGPENSYEGCYLRTSQLRYWNSDDIDNLKAAFAKTNIESQEFEFEFKDVCDYEREYDDDRDWPASFSFVVRKKN